ncbi:hypothetical protein TNIN_278031 [Trichonephila inaurata madagascariensis]|uniref:Uncharacterized protein n=1 Tax=Trichonephila inaurata madagascariensis TaxID=2747483 RepID=A0A8X7BWP3_9ARAC|nr:hypothetical protein TNIN_278031 [Trichonephila inaurata madagascariensis]
MRPTKHPYRNSRSKSQRLRRAKEIIKDLLSKTQNAETQLKTKCILDGDKISLYHLVCRCIASQITLAEISPFIFRTAIALSKDLYRFKHP